jgi:hypothetical protein
MNKKKVSSLILIIILLIICTILSGCVTIYTNEISSDSESVFPEANKPSEEDTCLTLYPDCYSWEDTSKAIGESTCFIGRIYKVYYEHDEVSDLDLWDAFFDPNATKYTELNDISKNTKGLVIGTIGRDISGYEGDCVVVYGKLYVGSDSEREARLIIDNFESPRGGITITTCNCPDIWR